MDLLNFMIFGPYFLAAVSIAVVLFVGIFKLKKGKPKLVFILIVLIFTLASQYYILLDYRLYLSMYLRILPALFLTFVWAFSKNQIVQTLTMAVSWIISLVFIIIRAIKSDPGDTTFDILVLYGVAVLALSGVYIIKLFHDNREWPKNKKVVVLLDFAAFVALILFLSYVKYNSIFSYYNQSLRGLFREIRWSFFANVLHNVIVILFFLALPKKSVVGQKINPINKEEDN